MDGFVRVQQFQPAPGNSSVFISAGTSSAAIALPAPGAGGVFTDLELTNDSSSNDVWVAFGDTNAVAAVIPTAGVPANGYIIKPGQTKVIGIGIAQPVYMAAIALNAGTGLYATLGKGA